VARSAGGRRTAGAAEPGRARHEAAARGLAGRFPRVRVRVVEEVVASGVRAPGGLMAAVAAAPARRQTASGVPPIVQAARRGGTTGVVPIRGAEGPLPAADARLGGEAPGEGRTRGVRVGPEAGARVIDQVVGNGRARAARAAGPVMRAARQGVRVAIEADPAPEAVTGTGRDPRAGVASPVEARAG
jgi:hypothetical protein